MLPLRDNVPTRSFPLVTVALIAANLAVWIFYELPDLNGAVRELAYRPCEVVRDCPVVGEPWEVDVFSSMFMHASWSHVLGNMLFLWIFGNNIEDALGKVRYLVFYILGGLAATALQTVVTLSFGTSVDERVPNLGASGAISAVLGAYLILLPTASVLTIIFIFLREIPAFFFLGFWFLFQLWSGSFSLIQPEAGGGVAFFAHVGGFVFGMLTVHVFAVRRPLRPTY